MAKTGFTSGAVFGLIKESVLSFIDDDALSKGASIAFYTVTSIAPVLVIIIAIAGLAFGHDAAQGANIVRRELGLATNYVPAADPALQIDVVPGRGGNGSSEA